MLGTLLRLVRTIFPRIFTLHTYVGVDFTIKRVLEIGRNTCRVTIDLHICFWWLEYGSEVWQSNKTLAHSLV